MIEIKENVVCKEEDGNCLACDCYEMCNNQINTIDGIAKMFQQNSEYFEYYHMLRYRIENFRDTTKYQTFRISEYNWICGFINGMKISKIISDEQIGNILENLHQEYMKIIVNNC